MSTVEVQRRLLGTKREPGMDSNSCMRQYGASRKMRKGHTYYVYILLCADGSYYTGYSNNPSHRLLEHLKGRGAQYTRMHKPSRIVYLQRHKTRRAAMVQERKIKTLTHEEKRKLIEAAI